MVGSLRIPYVSASILLAFLLGPPGAILSTFVGTRDIFEAFNRTVGLFFAIPLPALQGYLGLSLLFILFFYLLCMIRFMRQRLVSAETQLVSILPEGEATFDAIFGVVSKSMPPMAFAVLFMLVIAFQSIPELPDNFAIFCISSINTVFLLVAWPFWFILPDPIGHLMRLRRGRFLRNRGILNLKRALPMRIHGSGACPAFLLHPRSFNTAAHVDSISGSR